MWGWTFGCVDCPNFWGILLSLSGIEGLERKHGFGRLRFEKLWIVEAVSTRRCGICGEGNQAKPKFF